MERRGFLELVIVGGVAVPVLVSEVSGKAEDDYQHPVLYPPELEDLARQYNGMRRDSWWERRDMLCQQHRWVSHGMAYEVCFSPYHVDDDIDRKWGVSTFINTFVVMTRKSMFTKA